MPEWSEVSLMSDYINQKCKDKIFKKVIKNPINKQNLDESKFPKKFKIKAISRGKELQLQHIDIENNEILKLTITLGMSGNFIFKDHIDPLSKWPMITWLVYDHQYDHLGNEYDSFLKIQDRLELIDHRRFAKWAFRDWNPSRGYDIVTEHDQFRKLILDNIVNKNKKFRKPLCELLMDQSYFNGVGNYLLAEILGRLNVNPFATIFQISKAKVKKLLDLCYQIPQEAYILGGGQIKDWKNQNNISAKDFKSWLKFYQHKNSKSVITKTGRNFWYNKKWEKYNIYGN